MEPFLFQVDPEGVKLVKSDTGDLLRLSKLFRSLNGREDSVRNGRRMENLSIRRLNKQLVVKKDISKRETERKSIFFFNNISSPDSTAHSPAENVPVLPKPEEKEQDRRNSSIAVALLKRNNTNTSLFKSHHSASSNSSLSSLAPTGNTKSLFNNTNFTSGTTITHSKLNGPSSNSTLANTESTIAKKVQGTTSLFAKHDSHINPNSPSNNNTNNKQHIDGFGSSDDDDDDDSEWMDSDWSSECDSFDDDDDAVDDVDVDDSSMKFLKKVDENPPALKRSLLSGLFLDRLDKGDQSSSIKGNTNPKLVLSPNGPSKPTSSVKSISPLMQPISPKHNSGLPSALTELHRPPIQALRGMPSQISLHPQPVINKSSISLTSFYASNRRPAVSNAPPTASTLLPTALATHMFLPTKINKSDNNILGHGNINGHSHSHGHGQVHGHHQHISYAIQYYSQSNNPQIQRSNSSKGLELTHANLAQLANIYPVNSSTNAVETEIGTTNENNDNNINNNNHLGKLSESVSSFKSSSSIDIPGRLSRLRREKEIEKIREKERQEQLKQRCLDPNSNINLLEKELPLNLVDSLFNENKMFGIDNQVIILNPNDSSSIIADGTLGGGQAVNSNKLNDNGQVDTDDFSHLNVNYADDYHIDSSNGQELNPEQGNDYSYHSKGW